MGDDLGLQAPASRGLPPLLVLDAGPLDLSDTEAGHRTRLERGLDASLVGRQSCYAFRFLLPRRSISNFRLLRRATIA